MNYQDVKRAIVLSGAAVLLASVALGKPDLGRNRPGPNSPTSFSSSRMIRTSTASSTCPGCTPWWPSKA